MSDVLKSKKIVPRIKRVKYIFFVTGMKRIECSRTHMAQPKLCSNPVQNLKVCEGIDGDEVVFRKRNKRSQGMRIRTLVYCAKDRGRSKHLP